MIEKKRVRGSRVNNVWMKGRLGFRKGIRVWWGCRRALVPEMVEVDDFVSQPLFIVGIHRRNRGGMWLPWREKALIQTWVDGLSGLRLEEPTVVKRVRKTLAIGVGIRFFQSQQ